MNAQGLSWFCSIQSTFPATQFVVCLILTGIITIVKGEYPFTLSLMPFKEYSWFFRVQYTYSFHKGYVRDVLHRTTCQAVIVIFWGRYKPYYWTSLIPTHEADLITGRQEIGEQEEQFITEKGLCNFLQWMWDSLYWWIAYTVRFKPRPTSQQKICKPYRTKIFKCLQLEW